MNPKQLRNYIFLVTADKLECLPGCFKIAKRLRGSKIFFDITGCSSEEVQKLLENYKDKWDGVSKMTLKIDVEQLKQYLSGSINYCTFENVKELVLDVEHKAEIDKMINGTPIYESLITAKKNSNKTFGYIITDATLPERIDNSNGFADLIYCPNQGGKNGIMDTSFFGCSHDKLLYYSIVKVV